jgi:hypothetical protein
MKKAIALGLPALGLLVVGFSGTAVAKDRNHDRIADRWEKRFHLSLDVNQAKRDQDRDRVDNLNEFRDGLNPRDRDSDDDGIRDADENAGVVASFDGTTLTINLAHGAQVSGQVTAGTRIECRNRDDLENEMENEIEDRQAATASDDGSSGSGSDNSGPGSANSGPGNAGDSRVCSAADLTPGTFVHEAELEGATFEKVELVK